MPRHFVIGFRYAAFAFRLSLPPPLQRVSRMPAEAPFSSPLPSPLRQFFSFSASWPFSAVLLIRLLVILALSPYAAHCPLPISSLFIFFRYFRALSPDDALLFYFACRFFMIRWLLMPSIFFAIAFIVSIFFSSSAAASPLIFAALMFLAFLSSPFVTIFASFSLIDMIASMSVLHKILFAGFGCLLLLYWLFHACAFRFHCRWLPAFRLPCIRCRVSPADVFR